MPDHDAQIRTLVGRLPLPLAFHLGQFDRNRRGLRPNHLRAWSHLLDLAELFVQLGASISTMAALRPLPPASELTTALAQFLDTPLNFGHWLQQWKTAARCHLEQESAIFSAASRFVIEGPNKNGQPAKVLDSFAQLRNEQKRTHHYFTRRRSREARCRSYGPLG
jgi:hypothetical protein